MTSGCLGVSALRRLLLSVGCAVTQAAHSNTYTHLPLTLVATDDGDGGEGRSEQGSASTEHLIKLAQSRDTPNTDNNASEMALALSNEAGSSVSLSSSDQIQCAQTPVCKTPTPEPLNPPPLRYLSLVHRCPSTLIIPDPIHLNALDHHPNPKPSPLRRLRFRYCRGRGFVEAERLVPGLTMKTTRTASQNELTKRVKERSKSDIKTFLTTMIH
jgi:hypothetical protein